MNSPTPDDVATAVITRLVALAGWTSAVPNGISYGRRAVQETAGNYGIIMVEEQPPTNWLSNGTYTQVYNVEVTLWTTSGNTTSAGTASLRNLLDHGLGWTSSESPGVFGDPTGGINVPNAVATIQVKPSGGELKLSADLRNGQDVMAASKRVEVMIQGKR